MSFRFPLYAKILAWFFLNLVLLALAFYLVVRIQFRLGLDSLLSGRAGGRIQAVSDLIADELAERPRENWDETLERFSTAYQVRFYLFRQDGTQLAGERIKLPRELLPELTRGGAPPFRPQPPIPPERPRQAEPRPRYRPDNPPPPQSPPDSFRELFTDRPPKEGPPAHFVQFKFMRRTVDPARYWVGVRLVLRSAEPRHNPGAPVILLASSESLRGGGLFFDATPWVVAGFGAVLFSMLFWIPLVRGITRSVSQMTRATERIAQGHFETRVSTRRRDELGRLGGAVNHMASRLAGFVTGQKRFLGDTAHELCSPLGRMQVALAILEQRADEKQKSYVDDVREEVEQMSSLVNELLSFSKTSLGAPAIQLKPVALLELVNELVRREATPEGGVTIDVAPGLTLVAERELLKRALANLLRNARRYAGEAGPITIAAARDGERVRIRVSDFGPGVPEESLPRLFDPFYRVDNARSRDSGGVGLGMTIVKSCIEACGGGVTCRNLQPRGFEVEIVLNAASAGI